MDMENIKVISLGGSIIAPDRVDIDFLKGFYEAITAYLEQDENRKLILVTGGGGPARAYQNAYREISNETDNNLQDWIGIAATRLNGQLVKGIFGNLCRNEVITDPTKPRKLRRKNNGRSGVEARLVHRLRRRRSR